MKICTNDKFEERILHSIENEPEIVAVLVLDVPLVVSSIATLFAFENS